MLPATLPALLFVAVAVYAGWRAVQNSGDGGVSDDPIGGWAVMNGYEICERPSIGTTELLRRDDEVGRLPLRGAGRASGRRDVPAADQRRLRPAARVRPHGRGAGPARGRVPPVQRLRDRRRPAQTAGASRHAHRGLRVGGLRGAVPRRRRPRCAGRACAAAVRPGDAGLVDRRLRRAARRVRVQLPLRGARCRAAAGPSWTHSWPQRRASPTVWSRRAPRRSATDPADPVRRARRSRPGRGRPSGAPGRGPHRPATAAGRRSGRAGRSPRSRRSA